MEHKNANNVTDVDLYNGFVRVQKDGQAVSMYYGKKIVWSVVIGMEECEKWGIYTQVCYAMLAATYSEQDLAEMGVPGVKILVKPDGIEPFLIPAICYDSYHAIITKLRTHQERNTANGKNDND